MAQKRPRPNPFVHYHNDASIWAKGQMLGDVMTGYWEGFLNDGTYDKNGNVYKVTRMKPKAK